MLFEQLPSSHVISMVRQTVLGVGQRVTKSLCLPYITGGSYFQGFVPPNDMVDSESMVGIKPSDSSIVIRYQVEFTHTWLGGHLLLDHIYPEFMGNVSTLTNIPLELWCEDY